MRFMVDGPEQAGKVLLFAHGAGAPMDSDFMSFITREISTGGVKVVRFEFPYMQERRDNGKKRPPDRQEKLLSCFAGALENCPPDREIFLAGKSMGGRMASMLAADLPEGDSRVQGWLAFGYPFHPPGKPEKLRTEHLADISLPGLVLQGERDPFGDRSENMEKYLNEQSAVVWLPDGNHDLAPRKASGLTKEQNWRTAAQAALAFMLR
ncbi:dienelactone hydrolase family protein [Hahella aquimaris]|uniref:alpha/beta family hydrolase n=1 Tax=Hahella sp. HNIBRBA332 TaxID=3015983 RepID=UPI00273BD4AD|nr:alpha/beta family hydrolase [Hahella sp. HNIBRBA332]WLQ15320.1 dienelactone hydrolase family protein [Hahella sp. HNIBRBA332]